MPGSFSHKVWCKKAHAGQFPEPQVGSSIERIKETYSRRRPPEPVNQACGIEEGVDFVQKLLDVGRDFDALADIAGVATGLRCNANTGGLIQALSHFLK